MNLTTHFQLKEVVCKCGCQGHLQYMGAINQSVAVLQIIRNHWMAPVVVNSFYRCSLHNSKVGGVPGSFHVQGMAFDIRPQFGSLDEFYRMLKDMQAGVLHGVIWLKRYPTFVHVDIRYM